MRAYEHLNMDYNRYFYKEALKNTHFEFSVDKKEVEVYVGGYFLCSVNIKDISDECKHELFA